MAVENVTNKTPDYPYASEAGRSASASPKAKTSEAVKEKVGATQEEVRLTQEELNKAMERAVGKLGGEEGGKTANILFILMAILSKMTQTLQAIASTQADSLKNPTEMQRLYTTLMGKIKIWDVNNPPPEVNRKDLLPDADKDKRSDALQKIGLANSRQNALLENLRSQRDIQGENAKKIQSTINTSDDAQKGMLDFMQTFLQAMREWLAGIFR